ncbi:hypothetical protein E8E01_04820 [Methylorubrum populi]|uniref:hypothetical protein n=1 Tax=Methylorubrum populi TaxID=223967 RepID=UPI00114F9990|nr:hypothetical protein [Methylorubrum populi]QDI79800.1 hypothetical protein E8E01_04820 [Methylorubrum populi]
MTIRTAAEYQQALARLDEWMKVVRTRSISDAESAEFDALVDALDAYNATRSGSGLEGSQP